jgi:intein/homing endonuclease
MNLQFWKKETGNLMTHGKGLTKEQLTELQNLKEGDRLIMYKNSEKLSDSSPDFTLKVYKKDGPQNG